jgi:hypothetical protein
MASLPYKEGATIAVPLRGNELWAPGVVARMNGKGLFLGYFFGPPTDRPESPSLDLGPDDAVAVGLCGDRGLRHGAWCIVGSWPNWEGNRWPVPAFHRPIELIDRSFRITYAEDLLTETSVEPIPATEARTLPMDGILGTPAVEYLLRHRLLGED